MPAKVMWCPSDPPFVWHAAHGIPLNLLRCRALRCRWLRKPVIPTLVRLGRRTVGLLVGVRNFSGEEGVTTGLGYLLPDREVELFASPNVAVSDGIPFHRWSTLVVGNITEDRNISRFIFVWHHAASFWLLILCFAAVTASLFFG